MSGSLGPLGAGGTGGLDGVADVFAVAERSLADQLAVAVVDGEAVAGVGPRLLAADVLLHGAVDADTGPTRPFPSALGAFDQGFGRTTWLAFSAWCSHAGSRYSNIPSLPPSRP